MYRGPIRMPLPCDPSKRPVQQWRTDALPAKSPRSVFRSARAMQSLLTATSTRVRRPQSSNWRKLPTPFRKGGSVTAGNASGVNDGAAALIIASEAAAKKHGLTPIARILGGATAGVPPRIMGIGPIAATEKLCARLGLTPKDFDVVELNEAFASQGLATLRALGIADDAEFVNPNGGAIALGHPLGMTGARITGTAALELNLRGAKRALATMCIGVGQGIAIGLERL